MPGEPPDPLKIAAHLRDERTATEASRLEIAQLVTAYPERTAYAVAYRQASAAIESLTAAIDALDPPAPR